MPYKLYDIIVRIHSFLIWHFQMNVRKTYLRLMHLFIFEDVFSSQIFFAK